MHHRLAFQSLVVPEPVEEGVLVKYYQSQTSHRHGGAKTGPGLEIEPISHLLVQEATLSPVLRMDRYLYPALARDLVWQRALVHSLEVSLAALAPRLE